MSTKPPYLSEESEEDVSAQIAAGNYVPINPNTVNDDLVDGLIRHSIKSTNLNATFKKGSNPEFHIHIHTGGGMSSSGYESNTAGNVNVRDSQGVNIFSDGNETAVNSHNNTTTKDSGNVFASARGALEELDMIDRAKQDAAGDIDELETEVAKEEPDKSLVKYLVEKVKNVAPTVAAILTGAASIKRLLDDS